MPRALRVALFLAATCLLAGCSGGDENGSAAQSAPGTLRVMTFNIFYGGDELDLAKNDWCTKPEGCQDTFQLVLDAIRQSKADVVGLQEATGNTRKVAEALGWNFNERTAVISRYPIIDPGGADGLYVFVEPTPGRVVAISNVHLPATPYGPYWATNRGIPPAEIIALEKRVRLPAIQEQLNELPELAAEKIPVFLTGDFNSPSHLDWTRDVVRSDVPFPVDWPVSRALADAGFHDSFRAVHPDPNERPGLTWTPGGPESIPKEVHDRIDWVLSAGPAQATASSVVGEADYEGSDISLPQWPSDHRGVVSTFRVTPAETEFVAVESRSVEQGETLDVRFHTDQEGAKVLLRPGDEVLEGDGSIDGAVSATTEGFEPGHYEVILADARENPIAMTEFWLYEPGSETTISTETRVLKAGEPIRVTWTNAPGMKWDWIAPYKAGDGVDHPRASDCPTGYCGNGNYLGYQYTNATVEGSATLNRRLKPGRYDVRLLLDDGYTRAAISEPFVVRP